MTRGCIVGRDSCFAAAPSDPFPIYRIKRNRMNIRPQFLGVDFGTSNSTVGVGDRAGARLVGLESGQSTLPSAIFFPFDDSRTRFGRPAIEAYVGGGNGRLLGGLQGV